jgi:hypothetical protein
MRLAGWASRPAPRRRPPPPRRAAPGNRNLLCQFGLTGMANEKPSYPPGHEPAPLLLIGIAIVPLFLDCSAEFSRDLLFWNDRLSTKLASLYPERAIMKLTTAALASVLALSCSLAFAQGGGGGGSAGAGSSAKVFVSTKSFLEASSKRLPP